MAREPKRRAPVEREHQRTTNGGVERTDQRELSRADRAKLVGRARGASGSTPRRGRYSTYRRNW